MNPFDGLSAAEIALQLAEKYGFSVIPIGRGTKKALVEWGPYATIAPSSEQLEKWAAQFPGCNWGVVAGVVSDLVVFDADNLKAVDWAAKHLPSTPVRVKTSRGYHLYYHHPGPDYVEELRHLEFRSKGVEAELRRDGQYAVSPGSIHESGVIYTAEAEFLGAWEFAPEFSIVSPAAVDLSGLDAKISEIKARYCEVLEGNRHNTLLSYAAALIGSGCPVDRALKLTAEKNAAICTPPVSMKEIRDIVGGIYKTHLKNHPFETGKPEALAANMDGVELTPLSSEAPEPFPASLLRPGGILEQVMDYTKACSIRTRPEFSFGAGLAAIATLLGQRVRTSTGLTTNIYLALLGRSASGKDAPKRVITRILQDVTASAAFGGVDIASDAAVIALLARPEHHRTCFLLDEIGMLLKACKFPNSPRAGLVRTFTQLFSCYDTPFIKNYADSDKTKVIPWCSLVVVGFSVPSEFWGAIEGGELTNGFLSRFLVIENNDAPGPRNYDINTEIPERLLAALRALWAIPGGEKTPDKTDKGGIKLETKAKPKTIPFSPEAEAFIREKEKVYDAWAFAADEDGEESAGSSVWGRCGEHVRKLSLVFCASRIGAEGLTAPDAAVSLPDMEQAAVFAEWSARRIIKSSAANSHDSNFEAWCQAVKKAIIKYCKQAASHGSPKPGAPWAVIEKALKGATPRQAKEVRDKLIQTNELRLFQGWKKSPKSLRVLDLYCLVTQKEEDGQND